MKRSLIALLIASMGLLWTASTGRAQEQERNNQIGAGMHYWTTVKNIDVKNVDKNGFSYLAMYQYHYGWVGVEADLEWFQKGFGGAGQDVYQPQAYLILGKVIYAAAGNKPKAIEEFIGRVSSKTEAVSIARMRSPGGWSEPGQTPEFDEYTVVFKGHLRVKTHAGAIDVKAGQAVIVPKGEWVQYSTLAPEGAEYMAVCLPAFGPDIVHRDAESQTPDDGRQTPDIGRRTTDSG